MRRAAEVWDISAEALLATAPPLPPPQLNRHASNPRLLDNIVGSLQRSGVVGCWPPERRERRLATLRAIRMERFCGYFMPECSLELFELMLRWTTILWLMDDTMDKATDAQQLRVAVERNRRFVLGAFEGQRLPEAPAVVDLIVDFFRRYERATDPELVGRFRRAARAWLQQGAFALAEHRLNGARPSFARHVRLRRWDGAVDTCAILLASACASGEPRWLKLPRVAQLCRVTATHVALMNDIVSYEPEVIHPAQHFGYLADSNLIDSIVALEGCGERCAAERVLDYLERLRRRYEQLSAVVLERSAPGATGLRAYVRGLGEMMRGNILWSLESGRYQSASSRLECLRCPTNNRFEPLLRHRSEPR